MPQQTPRQLTITKLFLPMTLMAVLSPYGQLAVALTVYGAGTDSCGTWLEDRGTDSGWREAGQWVQGYLSGTADNLKLNPRETDSDSVLIALDNYCQANPQHSVFDAARGLTTSRGIRVAGPGGTEGLVGDQAEMNRICRDSFSSKAEGSFPVRWATTADYREYSTYKGWNNHMVQIEEPVALRAEDTLFTPDGRSYDQATGAISPVGKTQFPGAVIIRTDRAYFSSRRAPAKPLCVWGTPNFELR